MTVFTNQFELFVGMLRAIADSVGAQQKVDAAKAELEEAHRVTRKKFEASCRADAQRIAEGEDGFGRDREQFVEEMTLDLLSKRDDRYTHSIRRLSEQTMAKVDRYRLLLDAIDECARNWGVTERAIELAGRALSYFAVTPTDLDEPSREAVSRGYRASDAKTAKAALAKLKSEQEAERKEAERRAKEQHKASVAAEVERLRREVAAQRAPEQRLAELEAELEAAS